ncbi:hypothetical protein CORC01_04626, partial [Colletotrichum orchidophilum]
APLCCLLAQSFAGSLSAVPIRRLELCCGWLCYGASVQCPEIVDRMLLPECCAGAGVNPSRIEGAHEPWPERAVSESGERGRRGSCPGRKYMALAMLESSQRQKRVKSKEKDLLNSRRSPGTQETPWRQRSTYLEPTSK